MLGKRKDQSGLFTASTHFGQKAVAEMGFYGKVATEGPKYFKDSDFAGLYKEGGRPSVPPSILALARLLQFHDRVSDGEVVERCRYDIRWKAALDLALVSTKAPFAKSTFQAFRARLTLLEQEGIAFERSVKAARDAGLFPQKLRAALDSTPVRGRGAVKDTYNLLSDAISSVVRAIARKTGRQPRKVAIQAKVKRHLSDPSIKGSEIVDWSNEAEKSAFLAGLLQDCKRIVSVAKKAECATDEVALLEKVVADDVEQEKGKPPHIRRGVAKDRTVSIHDPEMRHSHKSTGKKYNGHKAHIAVDTKSGIITAVDVARPGEADGSQVANLVRQTRKTTKRAVPQAVGDAAYGTRPALKQARKARVDLRTKMPSTSRKGLYGASDFKVSRDLKTVRCPAGVRSDRYRKTDTGLLHIFPTSICRVCSKRENCTRSKKPGRQLAVSHDFHERRRRERYARSKAGRRYLKTRMKVEHAIGRVKHLGAGAARYFGRSKTRDQLFWTAAVANFSLVWSQ